MSARPAMNNILERAIRAYVLEEWDTLRALCQSNWQLFPKVIRIVESASESQTETIKKEGSLLGEELEWSESDITLEATEMYASLQSPWRGITDPDERYGSMETSFIEEMKGHLATLRTELGEGKPAATKSFGQRARGTMRRHHYEAYRTGRNKSNRAGLRKNDLAAVKEILTGEYGYLRGFAADLRAKWDKDGNIDGTDYRASMYGTSLRRAFNAGITSELADDDVVVISEGAVKTEHCIECPPRWGSYTPAEFADIGGNPVEWCEGFTRCKCIVSVEKAERK